MARLANGRTAILEAALDLFLEMGYEGTSLRKIAATLGVSKAALYHHFESKELLLSTLVEPFLTGFEDLTASEAGRGQPEDLLRAYFDLLRRHHRVAALIANDSSVAHHPTIRERSTASVETLRTRLAKAVGASERPSAVVRASAAIGAVSRPALRLHAIADEVQLRDEAVAAALRSLLGGRGTPSTGS